MRDTQVGTLPKADVLVRRETRPVYTGSPCALRPCEPTSTAPLFRLSCCPPSFGLCHIHAVIFAGRPFSFLSSGCCLKSLCFALIPDGLVRGAPGSGLTVPFPRHLEAAAPVLLLCGEQWPSGGAVCSPVALRSSAGPPSCARCGFLFEFLLPGSHLLPELRADATDHS